MSAAKRSLKEVVAEMAALEVTPDTISEEIDRLQRELAPWLDHNPSLDYPTQPNFGTSVTPPTLGTSVQPTQNCVG